MLIFDVEGGNPSVIASKKKNGTEGRGNNKENSSKTLVIITFCPLLFMKS
jgi:hypothetical protein